MRDPSILYNKNIRLDYAVMPFPQYPIVVLLMGLPGSGKTTLSRWLAANVSAMNADGLLSTTPLSTFLQGQL